MRLKKYALAAVELLLLFPSVLFMTALFVRNLQPPRYEPAHTAQQIVAWYAARPHIGLWLLLIALPFTVFIVGSGTLLQKWGAEAELRQASRQIVRTLNANLTTLLIAGATVTAGGILAIVALHVISD